MPSTAFNPDKLSFGYLTVLVATTHFFLKLMEVGSRGKKMIVSKKKKVVKKSTGPKRKGLLLVEVRQGVGRSWKICGNT